MRGTIIIIGALALAGCMASPQQQASERAEAEEDLAHFTKDRVAGVPQDCISLSGYTGGPTIIDSQRIVYQSGSKVYVNTLGSACPSLRPFDTLIVEVHGSQLCRNDRFRAVQPGTSIPGPYCLFGKFTPYARP